MEQLKNRTEHCSKKTSVQANDYLFDVSRGNNYISFDFVDVSHCLLNFVTQVLWNYELNKHDSVIL